MIVQFVVDHHGAEVEEVAFGPGLIESSGRNKAESSRVDSVLKPLQALFVRRNDEDRHALSVRGAEKAVNDKDDYSDQPRLRRETHTHAKLEVIASIATARGSIGSPG